MPSAPPERGTADVSIDGQRRSANPEAGAPGKAPPATSGLIAVCTVVFVVVFVLAAIRGEASILASLWQLDDFELLDDAGAMVAARVWLDGAWWRVITGGFLHGSWLHLGLNMMGLWAVGQWTERAFGWWRQLVLFGVSSIGGFLASLAWAEAPLVVGASAGIFGIAGALVVARAWGSAEIQAKLEPVSAKSLGFWLGFWLFVGFVLPLVGVELLAQAGHIGGLVFGMAVGWIYSRAPERRSDKIFGWIAVSAGITAAAIAGIAPSWRTNYHLFVGVEHLDRGAFERASRHLDRALAEDPEDPVLANAVAYALAEAGVDLERAEQLVRVALRDDPESADYLDTLGWIQCQRGFTTEGIASLEAAQRHADREIPEIEAHLDRCDAVGPR